MGGSDVRSGSLFSYVDLDARVPQSHPLRVMRDLVNACLTRMDGSFEALYKEGGRLYGHLFHRDDDAAELEAAEKALIG